MKTAHYFKFGKKQHVIISESNRPIGKEVKVENKKEARRVAEANDAKPWNF